MGWSEALCWFGAFGLSGVLLDLDHVPEFLWGEKWAWLTRALHVPMCILSGALCLILCALCAGWAILGQG
jgi:hypothetical protein